MTLEWDQSSPQKEKKIDLTKLDWYVNVKLATTSTRKKILGWFQEKMD
jgi:hypothetical protein